MKIDVLHIARLANLQISPDEEKKFAAQLAEVLAYVKKLDEVDTKGITETSQVTGLENVYREDQAAPSLTQEEALADAAHKHNNMFQVKGIFDDA